MIKIRYATLENINSWMALIDLVRWNFPGLGTEEELEGYRKTVTRFINERRAICAVDDNTVVGFLLFSTKHNMLCHMAVNPAYRRQKLASCMIELMLKNLDKDRDIVVTTFRGDDEKGFAPRALYKKFGFEEAELCYDQGYPEQKFILRAHRT